jgi:hypothetical protein
MLGRDHALLGGVGFLVVAPLVLHSPTWQELGVGCVTSAAFALLPDIDEPGSTVSRKLGLISRSVSEVTNKTPRLLGAENTPPLRNSVDATVVIIWSIVRFGIR